MATGKARPLKAITRPAAFLLQGISRCRAPRDILCGAIWHATPGRQGSVYGDGDVRIVRGRQKRAPHVFIRHLAIERIRAEANGLVEG